MTGVQTCALPIWLAFENEIIAAKKLGIIATKEGLFLVRECYENDAQIKQQYAVKLEEERIAAEKKAEEERIAAEKNRIENEKIKHDRKRNEIIDWYTKHDGKCWLYSNDAKILLTECSDIIKKNSTINIDGRCPIIELDTVFPQLLDYNLTLNFSQLEWSSTISKDYLSTVFSNYHELYDFRIVKKIIFHKSLEKLLKERIEYRDAVADDYKELKKIITYK